MINKILFHLKFIFNKENILNIIPDSKMNLQERKYTVVRFLIYLTVLNIFFCKSFTSKVYPLGVILAIYMVDPNMEYPNTEDLNNLIEPFNNQSKSSKQTSNQLPEHKCHEFPFSPHQDNKIEFKEIKNIPTENPENCREPTIDNPFMNQSHGYQSNNDTNKPACNVNNPDVSKKMNKLYYQGLKLDKSQDPLDDYGLHNFFTMANTTIPNRQDEFAQFLYGDMKNCKTNACDCEPNMIRN